MTNSDASTALADAPDDAETLARRVAALERELDARRVSRRLWLLAALAPAALAIAASPWALQRWNDARVEGVAAKAVARLPDFAAYPLSLNADGDALSVAGLAPSVEARRQLEAALLAVSRQEGLEFRFAVRAAPEPIGPMAAVPSAPPEAAAGDRAGLADLESKLERMAAERAELARSLHERLAAIEKEATILSAEIVAGERIMDRRASRMSDAIDAKLRALAAGLAEAKAAVARDAAARTQGHAALEALKSEVQAMSASDNAAGEAALDALSESLELARSETEARIGEHAAALQAMADRTDAAIAAAGERLAALEGQVAETRATAATAASALASQGEALAAIAADSAKTTARIDDIGQRSDSAFAAADGRIVALEGQVAETQTATTEAAAALAAQGETLATIAQRNAKATARIEDIAKRAEANAAAVARLAALADRIAAVRTSAVTAAERLASHDEALSALKADDAEALARIDGVAQRTEAIAVSVERLAALGDRVGESQAAAAAAAAGLAAQGDALAAVKRQNAETAAQINRIAEWATTVSSAIDDVILETSSLAKRLDEVSVSAERVAGQALGKDALEVSLRALRGELHGLAETVAALKTENDRQAARSKRIEAELASLRIEAGGATAASANLDDGRAAARTPAPALPAVSATEFHARLTELESRAAEAVTLLDQRLDRIAKEAQPRALTSLDVVQSQLAPLKVRFASLAQPADAEATELVLRQVGEIALSMPDGMRLRIVGYADSDGTTEANRITSKRRSDWVLDELARAGVPTERMLSVGRGAENLLSPDASDDSPNRRVEFEAF